METKTQIKQIMDQGASASSASASVPAALTSSSTSAIVQGWAHMKKIVKSMEEGHYNGEIGDDTYDYFQK
jgi:hypothetical protein